MNANTEPSDQTALDFGCGSTAPVVPVSGKRRLTDVCCAACADTGWVSRRCVRGACGKPLCRGRHRFTARCSCRAYNPRIVARQGSVPERDGRVKVLA